MDLRKLWVRNQIRHFKNRQMSLTTDRNDPGLNKVKDNGQQETYIVLSEEERAKGFVRPVRKEYQHVGKEVDREGTIENLEDHLTEGSAKYYSREQGYVAFLKYPESRSPLNGKYIKQDELDAFNNKADRVGGCMAITKMHADIAETYARNPKFYGRTFCVGCGTHLPVNEFIWRGTTEEVGS